MNVSPLPAGGRSIHQLPVRRRPVVRCGSIPRTGRPRRPIDRIPTGSGAAPAQPLTRHQDYPSETHTVGGCSANARRQQLVTSPPIYIRPGNDPGYSQCVAMLSVRAPPPPPPPPPASVRFVSINGTSCRARVVRPADRWQWHRPSPATRRHRRGAEAAAETPKRTGCRRFTR